MINNVNQLVSILMIIAGIMVVVLIAIVFVYLKAKVNENAAKKERKENQITSEEAKTTKNTVKQYSVRSVFDFMEFDKIEDNMISFKNGKKYVMVIECQGINYDLMSEEEKVAVEEGFLQFLNTLTGPIQIYVQTRKVNLNSSLQNYKEKVNEIEMTYNKQKLRYEQALKNPNISEDVKKREYYELVKQQNLYEYGKDIIYNTERMSLNKNILNKKYYIATYYYPSESGQDNLDKEELKELAFSELYTKAQSIIRTLSISGVMGNIMTSTELADLLYVAYNRDEAEDYGIDKAIRAKYDELYSTAPDYMEKKINLLEKEIDNQAYDLANKVVTEVQSERQKEYDEMKDNIDDIIADLAKAYIEESKNNLGEEVVEKSKEKIDESRKEKESDVQKKTKTRRTSSRA